PAARIPSTRLVRRSRRRSPYRSLRVFYSACATPCLRRLRHRRNRIVMQRALGTIGLKTVADPKYRFNVLLAVAPELFPQAADVDIQRPRADLVIVTPDSPQQGIARNDLARILDQQRQ